MAGKRGRLIAYSDPFPDLASAESGASVLYAECMPIHDTHTNLAGTERDTKYCFTFKNAYCTSIYPVDSTFFHAVLLVDSLLGVSALVSKSAFLFTAIF